MFKNYLLATIRTIKNNKAVAFINLLGLALGLTTCILIFLYVQDELSYDRFNQDYERIYRIESKTRYQGEEAHWAATQGHWIPRMMEKYAEIESGLKLLKAAFPTVFHYQDQSFTEKGIFYADSTFFDFFSIVVLEGDPQKMLAAPGQIVLTRSAADKYYGSEAPLGKTISSQNQDYLISGIIEDIPENSHIHFDILIPMADLRARWPGVDESGPNAFHSYVKLRSNEDLVPLKAKLNRDVYELIGMDEQEAESIDLSVEINFTPLQDIHLHSNLEKELEVNGNYDAIMIFSTIALFVLLIGCINYINLTTARSTRRTREVGVRKVVGAGKNQIFTQFLLEAFIMCFLGVLLALILVEILLPYFNGLTDNNLQLDFLANGFLCLGIFVTYVLISIISGLYPALILSGFDPLCIFRANVFANNSSKFSLYLRRFLVIIQFTISIALVSGTYIVHDQLQFISNKDLGFNKEQILVLPYPGDKYEAFGKELEKRSDVIGYSACDAYPGERIMFLDIRLPELAKENAGDDLENSDRFVLRVLGADYDIARTLDLEIVSGRNFSADFTTDPEEAFILNEAAVKAIDLKNPIGMTCEYSYNLEQPKVGKIIGIVKDFHYSSLHHEVDPLMIHIYPLYYRYLLIKVNSGSIKSVVENMENLWQEHVPDIPFDFHFLDTKYDTQYKIELNLGKIVTYFTILAILIASLGLLGLSIFVTQQKTKEIGIRKVLGSSAGRIVYQLSAEFSRWVLISNLIAWPLTYYVLNKWLDNFAFRIEPTIWHFLAAGFLTFMIALSTISFQTFKAANAKPIEALKYE